jgi:hypothetical protein
VHNTRTDTSQFARFDEVTGNEAIRASTGRPCCMRPGGARPGCLPAAGDRDRAAGACARLPIDDAGGVRHLAPGPRGLPSVAATAAVLGLIGAAVAPTAARAGDGETAVSAAAGFATYATPDEDDEATLTPTAGAALQATYERGFGDYAAWRAHLGGAIYGGGACRRQRPGTIGLSYRLDVLRYVPYVAVGVGVLVRGGGPFAAGVEPALEIGGGVDVLRGRARSWGVAAAITSFASDTTTLTVTVRSTWRWGYF